MLAAGTLTDVKGIGEGTAARVKEMVATGRLGVLDELRAAGARGRRRDPPGARPRAQARAGDLAVARRREPRRARVRVPREPAARPEGLRRQDPAERAEGDRVPQALAGAPPRLAGAPGRRARAEAPPALGRRPCASRSRATSGGCRRPSSASSSWPRPTTRGPCSRRSSTCRSWRRPSRGTRRRARSILDDGLRVSLRVVPDDRFFAALVTSTGSKAHVEALAARCAAKGYRLAEDGLFEGRHRVKCEEEEDVYRAAGRALRPARAAGGRRRRARGPRRPRRHPRRGRRAPRAQHLERRRVLDPRDGEEGAPRRASRGSRSATTRRSRRTPTASTPRACARSGPRSTRSTPRARRASRSSRASRPTSSPTATSTSPTKVLEGFDVVIGSVHSAFRQSEAVMTERLVRAVSNPLLHVLGHPTGRLLLGREGYAFDLERVLDACAKHGTAVELNANPHRLDLDEAALAAALDRGVPIAIDPDAHDLTGIDDVIYGVGTARRARVPRGAVLNALPRGGVPCLVREEAWPPPAAPDRPRQARGRGDVRMTEPDAPARKARRAQAQGPARPRAAARPQGASGRRPGPTRSCGRPTPTPTARCTSGVRSSCSSRRSSPRSAPTRASTS